MNLLSAQLQPFCQAFTIEDDEDGAQSEDEEPKFCGVCGDQAKGYHFNALTCEGCKGFFRRAIKRSSPLQCSFLNTCIITKNNRRSCQACRFQKCQAIGMRKEMVMSEEEVQQRRIKIRKRRLRVTSMQLSPQQEKMITELLTAHRNTFDFFRGFTGFRPIDRSISSPTDLDQFVKEANDHAMDVGSPVEMDSSCLSSSSSPCPDFYFNKEEPKRKTIVFTALPHLSDLGTYMIHDIIRFSKSLQAFRYLSIEDQITLLKGAMFEIMQIRFNMVFNVKASVWECGQIAYNKDDPIRAGFQPILIDSMCKFHHTLRSLGLQEEEYVLVQGISLFSPDRSGVEQHHFIDQQHESLALALKTYIDSKRRGPQKHLLYPRVLACLTELRTMTEEYSKQILQIQDIQPDDISPLIKEVISKDT